ncbi:MAG TPA: diguanylate cyclase, partial [Terriglobales bacterium]|nr:diguanylate cyclase [Terriglobales bacterium]
MAIDRGRPEATRAPGKKQAKRATPGHISSDPKSSEPESPDDATASQPAAIPSATDEAVAGQPAAIPPASSQRAPSQPAAKRPTFNRSAALRVIVADDSAVSREVLRRLLEAWGYEITLARDGAEAWELLQSGDVPTIAILDWMMPGIEGIELCRRVRELSRRHYTYILLLTAKQETQHIIQGLGSGADDYICKPPNPAEFEARLLVARRLVAFQESLLLAQERYRNLVESSSALICTHDLEGKLLSINQAAARGLRLTVEECIGRNIRDVLVPAARPAFDLYLEEIQSNQIARGNMLVVDSAGEKHVWAYTNRLIEDEGAGPYILGHAQDVTEQIEMQKALRESRDALLEAEKKLARCDVLTDLANRRAFYERAEQERKRAARYGRPLSLAYIDLDNFKQINDTRGHDACDQVLTNVATVLKNNLRAEDLAARLGGDEFALLLPEAGDAAAAFVIHKLHRLLTAAMQERNFPVTFSMGLVTYDGVPQNIEEMVQKADDLMY